MVAFIKESPGQTRKKADENQDKVKNTDKVRIWIEQTSPVLQYSLNYI